MLIDIRGQDLTAIPLAEFEAAKMTNEASSDRIIIGLTLFLFVLGYSVIVKNSIWMEAVSVSILCGIVSCRVGHLLTDFSSFPGINQKSVRSCDTIPWSSALLAEELLPGEADERLTTFYPSQSSRLSQQRLSS